ncbi:type II toxin-antitoxin system VapC family toxin [Aestuariimicrobium ganziense]|uniref:type II toxin-antitoxin system VapC family toxin n=1 Tax=Aestuariimicrobium ganziense TaxID=2773677 RepID=UPI0019431153|nr:type II toxin-antitoxin system VapC family toxin [Aestuariimicrobium ganziense]
MIIDSSAVMAILNHEPGARALLQVALQAPQLQVSAATWVELGIVADNRSVTHGQRLETVLDELKVEIVPVDGRQARVARDAHRRYGRGSGSPARLNFGDCFSYALASTTGQKLLFVGDDFTHTDIAPAI